MVTRPDTPNGGTNLNLFSPPVPRLALSLLESFDQLIFSLHLWFGLASTESGPSLTPRK
jgi:hypothetical protein